VLTFFYAQREMSTIILTHVNNGLTVDPLMSIESLDALLLNAVARVAVNIDIMTMPTNIQISPSIRAGMDLGARSPYLG
jgi:hypothetical protein